MSQDNFLIFVLGPIDQNRPFSDILKIGEPNLLVATPGILIYYANIVIIFSQRYCSKDCLVSLYGG